MRWIAMLLGLALMALAGLWFFTPVLDTVYARTVPQYANPRVAPPVAVGSQQATRGAAPPAAPQAATRGAAPAGSASGSSNTISTKALAENVMSMVNLGAGILGAWFTFLSYRMQVRNRRRRDDA